MLEGMGVPERTGERERNINVREKHLPSMRNQDEPTTQAHALIEK